jgi:riboflavin transporter FmnP
LNDKIQLEFEIKNEVASTVIYCSIIIVKFIFCPIFNYLLFIPYYAILTTLWAHAQGPHNWGSRIIEITTLNFNLYRNNIIFYKKKILNFRKKKKQLNGNVKMLNNEYLI